MLKNIYTMYSKLFITGLDTYLNIPCHLFEHFQSSWSALQYKSCAHSTSHVLTVQVMCLQYKSCAYSTSQIFTVQVMCFLVVCFLLVVWFTLGL